MDRAPTYCKPVDTGTLRSYDINIWNTALHHYQNGQFKESFVELLKYFDPSLVQNSTIADNIPIEIPHGSVVLSIHLDGDRYVIRAPFVKLPEGGASIAIMRKICELNFHPMVLSQINLNENDLCFEYADKLAYAHPLKIVDVLRETCMAADYYDDLFIKQYQTTPIREAKVDPLPPQVVEYAYTLFKHFMSDRRQRLLSCERRHWLQSQNDIIFGTFCRLSTLLKPQGYLRSRIEQGSSIFFSRQPETVIFKETAPIFQSLVDLSEEEFRQSLYQANFIIPEKNWIDDQALVDQLESPHWILNHISALRRNGDYERATYAQLLQFYYVQSRHILSAHVNELIETTLKSASNLGWADASNALWNGLNQIRNLANQQQKKSAVAAQAQEIERLMEKFK